MSMECSDAERHGEGSETSAEASAEPAPPPSAQPAESKRKQGLLARAIRTIARWLTKLYVLLFSKYNPLRRFVRRIKCQLKTLMREWKREAKRVWAEDRQQNRVRPQALLYVCAAAAPHCVRLISVEAELVVPSLAPSLCHSVQRLCAQHSVLGMLSCSLPPRSPKGGGALTRVRAHTPAQSRC